LLYPVLSLINNGQVASKRVQSHIASFMVYVVHMLTQTTYQWRAF